MRGVTFGGKHTYWDWGLLLREHPIVGPPVPKTKMVEVPASDDPIDITEVLSGKVHYECREITCKFTMMTTRDRWSSLYSEILNHLHGKRMEITLDHEFLPYFFETGLLMTVPSPISVIATHSAAMMTAAASVMRLPDRVRSFRCRRASASSRGI